MGYFISDTAIREIKERLNIVDLVESCVSVTRQGNTYRAVCPFHDDHKPSMQLQDQKGLFHCFACGAGGDIFAFYQRYNNVSFQEAAFELAKRAGVQVEASSNKSAKKSIKDVLYKINSYVADHYHNVLVNSPEGEGARIYLKQRGLTADIIKRFKLGYAQPGWDSLLKALDSKKIPVNHALDLGLIVKRKSGDGQYDRFRDRIVFPIIDVQDRVLGFGARVLPAVKDTVTDSDEPVADQPKYINSPESVVYKKSDSLYGLNQALDEIRRSLSVIIVEGYLDCLALYRVGIKNVIATLGTSLTANHLSILKRYTDKFYLVYDSDASGLNAAMRVLKIFLQEGLFPNMVRLPSGEDPDSFVSKHGKEPFAELMRDSFPLFDSYIDNALKKYKSGEYSRAKTVAELSDAIRFIKGDIDKSHFITKIADSLGVREQELFDIVKMGAKNNIIRAVESSLTKHIPWEILILKILLKYPEFLAYIKETDVLESFKDDTVKSIIKFIVDNELSDLQEILLSYKDDPSVQELVSDAVFNAEEITDYEVAQKSIDRNIHTIVFKNVEEKLKMIRIKMDTARKEGDDHLHHELIAELSDLEKKKTDLVKKRNDLHYEAI